MSDEKSPTRAVNGAKRPLLSWAIGLLVLAGLLMLVPLWAPLVFALWTAHLLRPVVRRIEKVFRGRQRIAAAVTLSLLLVVLAPLAGAIAALVFAATDLVRQAAGSSEWRSAFRSLVSNGGEEISVAQLVSPARVFEF